jgi:hypothetical protein
MAITHPTATRTAIADLIDDRVNGGAGAGTLVILTSGDAVLASITLQDPAFGAGSNGEITLAGTPLEGTASGTGTAAKFEVRDSDATVIYTGSVATSGGDLTIDNTSITSGQTVRVTSHSYTACA